MTFLNQFHKEAMERTMRKIEESEKSPMSSKDFCRLHEKEPRDGKGDGGRDMYVVDAEIKKLYVSECQTL